MNGAERSATTIDVVEAVYADLERRDPEAWLREMLSVVTSCAGEGLGGIAHRYRLVGPPSAWQISPPVVHEAPPSLVNIVAESFGRASAQELARWARAVGPTGTFSRLTGMSQEDLPSASGGRAARVGVGDQLYLNASDVDDNGLVFVINIGERRKLALAEARRLAMISAHLTAAMRLMSRLARLNDPAVIFEPDGRPAHVTRGHEPMLTPLRRRVVTIDRARGRGRRLDPDRALESWRALVDGRYTLIDRFESDGRRYVVAHRNAPEVSDPRGLTRTESVVAAWAARGHSDKLIAYELGMRPGTVSGLMARVFHKLGVRSRTAMAERLTEPPHASALPLSDGDDLVVFSDDRGTDEAWLAPLTPAERDVARAIARGLRNEEIAVERGVSARTVESQLSTIYKKLGVRSRAELSARRR